MLKNKYYSNIIVISFILISFHSYVYLIEQLAVNLKKFYSHCTFDRTILAQLEEQINLKKPIEIKKYRYDNPDDKTRYNIKIIACYHKPYTLWQNKVILPIHCGRSIAKVGEEIATDFKEHYKKTLLHPHKWLNDNMIGDDTGDNVSRYNRYWNEMTGIYWAWKNYDKIGNPEYIGVYHYGKLLEYRAIEDVMEGMDLVTTQLRNVLSVYFQYMMPYNKAVSIDIFNETMTFIKDKYPSQYQDVKKFFEGDKIYFNNIFIMKRELFFEYSNWIFPILFKLEEKLPKDSRKFRDIGMIAERLTGYFLLRKSEDKRIKSISRKLLIL
ncbi:MAG: DUF4422 domain-containing protein [Rickettsiales bacterium]|jgi:hypothetical protein|nr:DUF4422 domain-containing protein [Rickettsiales bacterium]